MSVFHSILILIKGKIIVNIAGMKTYFLPVFYTVLQLLILIGLGFGLRKIGKWGDDFFRNMSSFLFKIILPVYLFVHIAPGSLEDLKQAWIFPLAGFIIVFAGVGFGLLVFRIIPLGRLERKGAVALSAFGNSGFIPLSLIEFFPISLPIIAEIFGVDAPLLFVGAYLIVQSALLWTLGNYLIIGRESKISLGELINRPFVAICIAFLFILFMPDTFFTNKSLPFAHIYSALERLSRLVLPLALISLGSMIGNLELKKLHVRKAMVIAGGVSVVRFLFMPAFFFGIYFAFLRYLHLTKPQLWVLFIECHVPPALNLSVMVNHAGVNREHTAFTMLFTYLLYLGIFPFFVILFFSLPGIGLGGFR